MTLYEKQVKFALMLEQLLRHARELGYEFTIGEVERRRTPVFLYEAHVKAGSHPRSTHFYRLAVDLHLFKNGVYLDKTEHHQELGEFWESLGGSWGGRFGDGNHYSLEYNGVR